MGVIMCTLDNSWRTFQIKCIMILYLSCGVVAVLWSSVSNAIWSIESNQSLAYNILSQRAEDMINMQLRFRNQETD